MFIFHTQLRDQCCGMMDRWLVDTGGKTARAFDQVCLASSVLPWSGPQSLLWGNVINFDVRDDLFSSQTCAVMCLGDAGTSLIGSLNYGSSCNHQKHRVFMFQQDLWSRNSVSCVCERESFFAVAAWGRDSYCQFSERAEYLLKLNVCVIRHAFNH